MSTLDDSNITEQPKVCCIVGNAGCALKFKYANLIVRPFLE